MRFALYVTVLLLFCRATAAAGPGSVFLVESYFRQARYDKALEALKGVAVAGPRLRLIEARCLAGLERRKEAVQVLRGIIEDFPRTTYAARARHQIIQILEEDRDWHTEIEYLRRFVEAADSASERSAWRRLLAYTLLKAGKVDDALSVISSGTSGADLDVMLDILHESGRWKRFVASNLSSGDPVVLRRLADLLLLDGDYSEAVKIYRKLLSSSSGAGAENKRLRAGLLKKLLECERALGDDKAQLDILAELAAACPGEVYYHQELGDVRYRLGDIDGALSAWRRIVELNPRDEQAYLSLASVLQDHELYAKAVDVLKEGAAVTGRPTAFSPDLSRLLGRLGRYDEAADLLVALVVSEPGKARKGLEQLASMGKAARRACEDALKSAMEKFPSISEYYSVFDAVIVAPKNDHAAAAELAAVILRNMRSDTARLRLLADEFERSRRYEVAEPLYSALVSRLEGGARYSLLMKLAVVEVGLGKLDSALEHIERILEAKHVFGDLLERAAVLKGRILFDEKHLPGRALEHWLSMAGRVSRGRADQFRIQAAGAAASLLDFKRAGHCLSLVGNSLSSGLKAAFQFQKGRLLALQGAFDQAMECLRQSVELAPDSESANRALALLVFLVVHLPPSASTGGDTPGSDGGVVHYLRLRELLCSGQLARYSREAAKVEASRIAPSLKDEFMLLSAEAAGKRGDRRTETEVLRRFRNECPDSPYRDRVLVRLAKLLAASEKSAPEAIAVLEEHLMDFPDSLRADTVRALLARLKPVGTLGGLERKLDGTEPK